MVKIEHIRTRADGVSGVHHCQNEIPGLHPITWTAPAGASITYPADCGYYHILILVEGKAAFTSGEHTITTDEKLSYVPAPDAECFVRAETDIYIMELAFDRQPADDDDLAVFGTKFPICVPYQESIQYIDPYKSQKTISRMMIPHKILPRFSMGSVETYGYDLVTPHTHPMLDQLFFSFPENDMEVIIDDVKYPMRGNDILHIPLGSNHGVEVTGDRHLHYMWIDVMPDQAAGLKRLDASHKPTGLNRDFKNER